MTKKSEIITVKEALIRINLPELGNEKYWNLLVEWTGYPRPFPSSHTKIYAVDSSDNKYKALNNQLMCKGDVLFSWNHVEIHKGNLRKIGSYIVVLLVKVSDQDTCLKLCMMS